MLGWLKSSHAQGFQVVSPKYPQMFSVHKQRDATNIAYKNPKGGLRSALPRAAIAVFFHELCWHDVHWQELQVHRWSQRPGPDQQGVIVIGRYWGCSFHQVWEYPYLGGFAAGILSLPSISCKKYVINTISTLCSIMFFAFFPLPREPSSVVNLQMAVFCQQLSTVHMPYPGMHSSPYKARMTMVLVIEHFINLWW